MPPPPQGPCSFCHWTYASCSFALVHPGCHSYAHWHTDQWSSRATPGRVVSPSGDLHRGHLVLTADGQFLHSDSLVEGVCQGPHPEHHVAEHLLPPLRRHSGKGPPDASVAAPPAPRQGGVGEISLPGSGEGQGSGPGEDVEISKAPELHPLSLSLKRKPLDL